MHFIQKQNNVQAFVNFHIRPIIPLSGRPGVSNIRPAGQIRPFAWLNPPAG